MTSSGTVVREPIFRKRDRKEGRSDCVCSLLGWECCRFLFFLLSEWADLCAVEGSKEIAMIACNGDDESPLASLRGRVAESSVYIRFERLQAAKRTCSRTRPCSSWRYSTRVPWSFLDHSRIASTTISSPSSLINLAAVSHVSAQ